MVLIYHNYVDSFIDIYETSISSCTGGYVFIVVSGRSVFLNMFVRTLSMKLTSLFYALSNSTTKYKDYSLELIQRNMNEVETVPLHIPLDLLSCEFCVHNLYDYEFETVISNIFISEYSEKGPAKAI